MEVTRFIPILLLAAVCSATSIGRAGCKVQLNDEVLTYLPLLLKPNGGEGHNAFYLPEARGVLNFNAGSAVTLTCPGGHLVINGQQMSQSQAEAKCSSGVNFQVLGKTSDLTKIKCSSYPGYVARYSGKSCLKKYKEIEIGFDLPDGRFLKFISVCYDNNEQNTLYSQFELTKTINGYQVNYPRNDFVEGSFYHLGSHKLNSLYTRYVQRLNVNKVLGLDAKDYTYIHDGDDFYLARGHLTAKADFVYGAQHRFTFQYVNAAPQWQTFNKANWNSIEQNVRDYASRQKKDLLVYTGTWGITKLPNKKTQKDVPLYLYVDGTKRGVPVPEVFWKVAYDPITKKGIAFIGVNNPYKDLKAVNKFCTDICSKISWLTAKVNDKKSGFIFCCDVNDFRKTVNRLPEFSVSGVLY